MRQGSIRGRRAALAGASATVLCLGGVAAACGSGGGPDGYVAVQAPQQSGAVVAPTGDVSLMPLDGGGTASGLNEAAPDGSSGPEGAPPSESDGSGPSTRTEAGGVATSSSMPSPLPEGDNSGRTSGDSGRAATPLPPTAPGSHASPQPAVLRVGDPRREATEERWCEKVTVSFRNTGGTAVRSGTVTFGTHIIGALGIDWATIESTEDLPAPIAAGAKKDKTWTVCVDAWHVPLGMHIKTRDVSVQWK
ncbi:hypothetical protein C4B68_20850 [Streptomyces dengpaensis]|uniref:Secreted protein n=1 Tax=Streptomyces dengpaensis TaxID=2049881 RepID=A0ABN5I487_9ACTN|nr:hypothetical protein [Streptomyces dengpaensis]AVH57812.1 hypothetical protein C4B68_20850 [Streptomyces dengpaensis]PIB04887.1 hypothetical protein B1C81_31675 [Streptomyces sp. HG99]